MFSKILLPTDFSDCSAEAAKVARLLAERKARECRAGLVVIGTHGRTGVEHVIFGSTAEKVVRNAPCPVFSVRMGIVVGSGIIPMEGDKR